MGLGGVVEVGKKYKSCIYHSIKKGYVTAQYLFSDESEKVGVGQCREVPPLNILWYHYGSNFGDAVATPTQDEIIKNGGLYV